MQNLSRLREQPDPRSFAARKGHLPQLSISDDNHHVTEAIGYMYGDDDSPSSPQSPARHQVRTDRSLEGEPAVGGRRKSIPRKPAPDHRGSNGDRIPSLMHPASLSPLNRQNGWEDQTRVSPVSPMSARDSPPAGTANTHFPLNDIDYESSPAAVAQELSNLQALRRMSMDIGAAGDPDLPQLNTAAIPKAPSSTASEDDSARLFWVPARLHPELAPKEFKSFLESKAEQIKRRSGELSAFSSPNASRSSSLSSNESSGSLRRKKSMLSRQIENSIGYQDGAERLEHKKSQEQNGHPTDPNLEELESLVSGNTGLSRSSFDRKTDEETGDIILPAVPGSSLKRSTRTQYKRPSSRKGPTDQSTYAERARRRAAAGTNTEGTASMATVSLVAGESDLPNFQTDVSDLALTLRDPSVDSQGSTFNFSRPGHRSPSPPPKDGSDQGLARSGSTGTSKEDGGRIGKEETQKLSKRLPYTPAVKAGSERPIPQIVETPPAEDHPVRTSSMAPPPSNVYSVRSEPSKQNEVPARERPKTAPASRPAMPVKQSSSIISSSRPSSRGSNMPPQTPPSQTLEQPSPLPGHDGNTSNLSFIPTLTVDKRQESKRREEKKSGWGWLLGKEESDKDKDKDKTKGKGSKNSQSHDSTRLDVLQTSIDGGPKGRESLVLDREILKLEEERKKESQRKSSGNERKEKEGLFSSIFGGKKHKAEKEAQRKAQERLSPEPPYRELKPDIDYNWTRFSILEERAIYRMAHIKLANPRRALYSQVLLSNFMYSYLAKVQQMHPQMNLPTSAKQQRKQKEQQQQLQQQQQPDEYTQYQRYQEQQDRMTANTASSTSGGLSPTRESHQSFNSDSDLYNYNYSRENQWSDPRANQHSVDSSTLVGGEHYSGVGGSTNNMIGGSVGNSSQYHQQPQQHPSQRQQQRTAPGYNYDDDDDDDMW